MYTIHTFLFFSSSISIDTNHYRAELQMKLTSWLQQFRQFALASRSPRQQIRKNKSLYRQPQQLECLEDRALLATITVGAATETALRNAVNTANTNSDASNVIDLTGLTGTITLTTGELRLTKSVTINGPGAGSLAISGGNNSRLFWIGNTGAASTYSINGLTLRDGNGVGGRDNRFGGAISFTEPVFEGNDSLSITASVLTNNTADIGGAISAAGSGTLNINDTTITQNSATSTAATRGGGGLSVQSMAANLTNVVVSNNTAAGTGGGIYNFTFTGAVGAGNSTLTVNGGSITGNNAATGGGIYNENQNSGENATTTLNSTTVSGNTAVAGGGGGGGIWNNSIVNINGSRISTNGSTGVNGGGIRSTGPLTINASEVSSNFTTTQGGGIFQSGGSLTINNSTISQNTANGFLGGISVQGGAPANVTNATIIGNRGDADGNGAGLGGGFGANPGSTLIFHNTIVAGNTVGSLGATTPSDVFSPQALSSTSSFNIIGDSGSSGGLTHGGANNNIVGNNGSGTLDASTILSSFLGTNGSTGVARTHALVGGGIAHNSGSNAQATGQSDGRGGGFGRILGSAVDRGAFEIQADSLIVDNSGDSVDGNYSAGQFTLREAISLANSRTGTDSISFSPSLWASNPASINLGGTELAISDDVNIQGPGANLLTINAQGNSRVLRVLPDSTGHSVLISGLSITGGDATMSTDNSAFFSGLGGGILNEGGNLTVIDTRVHNNTATFGAGINNFGDNGGAASLVLRRSTLDNNNSTSNGSALYNWGNGGAATAAVTNSTISTNTNGGFGAIYNWTANATLTVTNSTIVNNPGTDGIHNDLGSGSVTLNNSIVAGHSGSDVFGGLTAASSNNVTGTVPNLGPLQLNGSGTTPTHALQTGSTAIDAGSNTPIVAKQLVHPASVTVSTATTDFFPARQLLDAPNLTIANYTIANAPQSSPNWATDDPNGSTGDYFANGQAAPVLNFNLGRTFQLTDVVAWAYSSSNNNDARTLSVQLSTDGGATLGSAIVLTKPNHSTEDVSTLPLGGTFPANFVRITITDNYFTAGQAGGDRVGLNEVRFLATQTDQNGAQRIVDGDGDSTATVDIGATELEPSAFVVTGPVGRTPLLRPTISWTAEPGALSYNVYVNIDNGGTNVFQRLAVSNTQTSLPVTQDLDFGRYRVFVEANMPGDVTKTQDQGHTFIVDVEAQLNPIGATIDASPQFTWNRVSGASSYVIFINQPGSPITATVADPGSGSTVSHTISAALASNDYKWWVRPIRLLNTTVWEGPWGDASEFSTGGRTKLTSPAPDGTVTTPTPTLTWSPVPGAVSYEVYVTSQFTPGILYRDAGIPGNTVTARPLPGGKLKVWIRTTLANGTSVWGSGVEFMHSFTTTATSANPLTPMGPGFDTLPTFTWEEALGSPTGYEILLHNGVSSILRTGLTGTSHTETTPLSGGAWTWYVRPVHGGNFGNWRSQPFSTNGLTSLTAPSVFTTDTTPTFTWRPVDGVVTYSLQVDNRTTNTGSVIREDSLTTNSFTPATPLTPGAHRAWVRATGSSITGPWSFQFDFVVAGTDGGATSLTSPGSTTSDTTPMFAWTAVSGADVYSLQVDNQTTNTTNVIRQDGLASNSFTPTVALPAGSYRAWVRAVTNSIGGPWSQPFDFVIAAAGESLTDDAEDSNTTQFASLRPFITSIESTQQIVNSATAAAIESSDSSSAGKAHDVAVESGEAERRIPAGNSGARTIVPPATEDRVIDEQFAAVNDWLGAV